MKMKDQKGAAMVEFALIAPLLFVILFGIIEFSVLLYDKAMLTNASREGARVGIVFIQDREDNWDDVVDDIEAAVNTYAENYLISFDPGSSLEILINPAGYDSGQSLTVTVNYPFQFLVFSNLIGLLGGDFSDGLNLQAVTVMRLE